MPRRPRNEIVDGLCHVTARGNRRARVFREDRDFVELLMLLNEAVQRHSWTCHAFCVMPNHYHLVVDAPQPALSAGMGLLNGVYAQRFNRRYGLTGHVFQGRFHSQPITRESHFVELFRYVLLNPVRARLCRHPREWRWSSYRAYFEDRAQPPFLTVDHVLGQFGIRRSAARRELAAFVGDGRGGDSPGTVPYPKP